MSITPDFDLPRTETRQVRVSKESRTLDGHNASDIVQWFLDYYWIRHPISEGSIAAYRADLLALDRWLAGFRNSSLVAAGAQDLRAYLESRYRAEGRQPGEIPSLTCIKRFYFYLVDAGLRADDPTEHVYVRMPRRAKTDLTVVQGDRT